MFWEKFVILCNNKNMSPNGVCADLGFSTAIATKWKNGSTPRSTSIQKIADYFSVSVDYLLGKTNEPSPTSNEKIVVPDFAKTAHEKAVIDAYRAQPELQIAVDKLLGVEHEGKVYLYTAASSDDKRFDEITEIPTEKWNKIKNAPQTDDDLM